MITAILTDIEGTTSSISFVHDVLFPYARARMAGYVSTHAGDPEVREQLAAVAQELGREVSDDEAVATLLEWIDQDRKLTPLKALQGMIWEHGYCQGDFTGHIYPDAYARLLDWQALGIRLYVYSSGSVAAQKLLFAHTEFGDLTPFFSGYFDTRIGAKREAVSYQRIAQEIGLPSAQILFLSDIEQELDAARLAGMPTYHLVRDQQPEVNAAHRQIKDFGGITI